jgi:hypothetical protein
VVVAVDMSVEVAVVRVVCCQALDLHLIQIQFTQLPLALAALAFQAISQLLTVLTLHLAWLLHPLLAAVEVLQVTVSLVDKQPPLEVLVAVVVMAIPALQLVLAGLEHQVKVTLVVMVLHTQLERQEAAVLAL